MGVVVSLRDVVDKMDAQFDEWSACIHRRTGELTMLTEEEIRAAEDDEEEGGLDADPEVAAKAREVLDSDDWIELPSKFDIHEYEIMERFCLGLEPEELRDEFLNAIRGRGAFRYFKDRLHHHGIQDAWYRFRDQALEQIAADFLDEHGIAYTREKPPGSGS